MIRIIFASVVFFSVLSCTPQREGSAPDEEAAPSRVPLAATTPPPEGVEVQLVSSAPSSSDLQALGLTVFKEPLSLPELQLEGRDGVATPLSSYRGKIVMLNFWATWCPPCREEMPSMERLRKTLAGKDFEIVAVSVNEPLSTVEAFLAKNSYTFPIYLDRTGEVSAGFVGRGIPTTYILDKEGRAIAGIIGGREWDTKEVVSAFTRLAKR